MKSSDMSAEAMLYGTERPDECEFLGFAMIAMNCQMN